MTFSTETKKQLAERVNGSPCCQLAEFLALTKCDGTLGLGGGDGPYLKISTENVAVAKKIYRLTKELFREPGRLLVYKNTRLKKNHRYEIRIPYRGDDRGVLTRLGLVDADGTWQDLSARTFPYESVEKDCCKRAYLRGAFLGSGSVNDPEKNYHLEIVSNGEDHAEGIRSLMAACGVEAKICRRKHQYVVYLKNADQIAEFFIHIGAHRALLALESERVRKGLNNNLNRRQNCDMGNIGKIVDSGTAQARAVRRIEETIGLDALSPALREAAILRLENPGLSLAELAAIADPPVSKSGMNHRMKKIRDISENLS